MRALTPTLALALAFVACAVPVSQHPIAATSLQAQGNGLYHTGSAMTEAKPPVAITISGGGMCTMTAIWGMVRAFEEAGAWPSITHWFSNSGGTWGSLAALYAPSFFAKLTDSATPLVDIIAEWGADFDTASQRAFHDGHTGFNYSSSDPQCSKVSNLVQEVLAVALTNSYSPLGNWNFYTALILNVTVPNALAPFSSAPRALPDITYGAHISILPDMFATDITNVVVDRTVETSSPPPRSAEAPVYLARFLTKTQSQSDDSEWFIAPGIVNATLKAGSARKAPTAPLTFPADPSLLQVGSGSGAFAGVLASKDIMAGAIGKILYSDAMAPVDARGQEKFGRVGYSSIKAAANKMAARCLPLGIETVAPPLLKYSAEQEWAGPQYRLADGGLTDNSAVTGAISAMQKECAQNSPSLDCSKRKKLVATIGAFHITMPQNANWLQALFETSPDRASGKWFPALAAAAFPGIAEVTYQQSPQIFAEKFPDPTNWTAYYVYNFTSLRGDQAESSTSLYWQGIVTTVDNPEYGVTGGEEVDLLMFSLEQPKQVSLWYPGKTAGWYFEHVMAPFVAGATGAAAPIIKNFLQP